ncbi:MAG: bifunctional (p)ppGpp synthetase/guanosine-3',5'-bis(diphosphate) 3'-pyrophosphohydrolase [Acetobacteraceae bacterium]|nr:bifunctional (p)ppGpp synthetase/guanosine-3',5'-bis(diphosphate) 3'-pyrophosphohydrolase [Acetobacteraceae bacterium]
MEPWITVLHAADTAARWHVHQRRKGEAGEPYINHLLEVALLVAQATKGQDVNLVIAALLHDVIEDCDIPATDIAIHFNSDVAGLVQEVTDDKTLPKAERKRRQIDHAAHASARAKILKLADKISNLRALAASPPKGWSAERRLDYVDWSRHVATGLRGADAWLETELAAAAQMAERATEQSEPTQA